MKRFLLFTGMAFYPSGGWDDFKGDFKSQDEAHTEAMALYEGLPDGLDKTYYWAQIVDTKSVTAASGATICEAPRGIVFEHNADRIKFSRKEDYEDDE